MEKRKFETTSIANSKGCLVDSFAAQKSPKRYISVAQHTVYFRNSGRGNRFYRSVMASSVIEDAEGEDQNFIPDFFWYIKLLSFRFDSTSVSGISCFILTEDNNRSW